MRKYANTTEETFVTFHIGRGGRFNNSGHRSYVDQDMTIDSYTDDLFSNYENHYEFCRKFGKRENLIALLDSAVEGNDDAQERLAGWGFDLGEEIYTDCNGTPVGLKVINDGTGCIDNDGDYDTTYVNRLEDCNDDELELIYNSNNYVSTDVREYCKKILEEKNIISE